MHSCILAINLGLPNITHGHNQNDKGFCIQRCCKILLSKKNLFDYAYAETM